MRKLVLLLGLFLPGLALAQSGTNPVVVNGNHVSLAAPNATPSSLNLQVPNAGGTFNIYTGGSKRMAIDGSGNLSFPTTTTNIAFPAAAVVTPATSFPTPGGAGGITYRNSIVAAGAPTATFVQLPLATISVGKTFSVFNQSSNPAAIVPISGDTQGVSAAATPFACTTLKTCDCTALTSANWMCGVK